MSQLLYGVLVQVNSLRPQPERRAVKMVYIITIKIIWEVLLEGSHPWTKP